MPPARTHNAFTSLWYGAVNVDGVVSSICVPAFSWWRIQYRLKKSPSAFDISKAQSIIYNVRKCSVANQNCLLLLLPSFSLLFHSPCLFICFFLTMYSMHMHLTRDRPQWKVWDRIRFCKLQPVWCIIQTEWTIPWQMHTWLSQISGALYYLCGEESTEVLLERHSGARREHRGTPRAT